MEKKIIKGVTLNDIHFGIKESKRVYEELSQVKSFLKENEISFLTINGDYFHCKLSLNEPSSFFAISFFKEIFDICKEKKIIFRLLQGTRAHDLNQISIFQSYTEDPNANFRIIFKAEKEKLFSDFKILYLPEEYPENADEYYKNFKSDSYSAIFGHGTWDFVAFDSQIVLGDRNDVFSAPIFKWEEWKNSVENGFISFGHIHGRNTYKKKIFYSGAFSRWEYGERSERGFTYFEYNLETKKYSVKFINNEKAPKFDVLSIKELEGINLIETSVEDIKLLLDAVIEKSDFLRIDLSGLTKEKQEILKKFYLENSKVKIEIREKQKLLKESSIKNKEKFEKYAYITKRQMPLNEIIKKFAKEEYNEDLELEKITQIITKKEN